MFIMKRVCNIIIYYYYYYMYRSQVWCVAYQIHIRTYYNMVNNNDLSRSIVMVEANHREIF